MSVRLNPRSLVEEWTPSGAATQTVGIEGAAGVEPEGPAPLAISGALTFASIGIAAWLLSHLLYL